MQKQSAHFSFGDKTEIEDLKFKLQKSYEVGHEIAKSTKKQKNSKTWKNHTSDIWFATKTEGFLFNQKPAIPNTHGQEISVDFFESNLWIDIPHVPENDGRYPQKLFEIKLWTSSNSPANKRIRSTI